MASYYIGLSLLSSNGSLPKARSGILSAEGRRILSLLEGRPLTENDITKEKDGRPFFPDHRADFNISHSGNMVAVSFVNAENIRVGCDVQIVRPRVRMREIAEEFFSAAERDYIFSDKGEQNGETRFFQIWALKESFLKLRGLSVFDMNRCPSFICGNEFGVAVSTPLTFNLYELSGFGERYILAVAVEGSLELKPEIRWFSQSFLSARSIAEIKSRGESLCFL